MSPTTKVFVDTSAFYAFLDRDDANHKMAVALFKAAIAMDKHFAQYGKFVIFAE